MLIPLDGVPLGQQPPEFRRPKSSHYATSYLEARAVVRMLVELDIHDGVADVRRGDSPDVAVLYGDGRRVYVEQAMVLDDIALQFSLAVEDANAVLQDLVKGNPAASRAYDRGMLTVRLGTINVGARFETEPIAHEVVSILEVLAGRVDLMRADPKVQPLLAAMDARIFYRPGNVNGGGIDTPAFHARPGVFEPTFRRVLDSKIRKAASYEAALGPLWLLLSTDLHFGSPSLVQQSADRILSKANVAPFSRVIVQMPGFQPLVVDGVVG